MKQLISSLTDFYAGLQVRERLFLIVGAVAVSSVLTVNGLLPLWEDYNQLAQQKQRLENDLQWLQQQRAAVTKLANNCPMVRQQRGPVRSILTQLVRRNQLQLDMAKETANGISLSMTVNDSNKLLMLTHQIACRGYRVDSLTLSPIEGNRAALSAMMEVQTVD